MHVLQPFASKYVRFGRTVNTNMFNRPLRNRYRPLRPLRLSGPLRGRLWRPGPPGPPAFSVFCFLPPPAPSGCPGPPLSENSISHRLVDVSSRSRRVPGKSGVRERRSAPRRDVDFVVGEKARERAGCRLSRLVGPVRVSMAAQSGIFNGFTG